MNFPLHTKESAPKESQNALKTTERNFGMIPNLERVMASAPPVLKGYSTLWDLFDETTLSEVERQVVYMTANFENECNYCVPWHSLLSQKAGMSPEDLEALREGGELADSKLNVLSEFTRTLIASRGKISKAHLEAFFSAGFSDVQALEVVLGLAVKTMSNFTNSIAGTPLDAAVKSLTWEKPTIKMRVSKIG